MVVMLWLRHVMDGVVFITHKAEHKAFVGGMDLQTVMPVFVGDRADVGDLPIDIGARKGLFLAVHLFVNGSLNDILCQCGEREGE